MAQKSSTLWWTPRKPSTSAQVASATVITSMAMHSSGSTPQQRWRRRDRDLRHSHRRWPPCRRFERRYCTARQMGDLRWGFKAADDQRSTRNKSCGVLCLDWTAATDGILTCVEPSPVPRIAIRHRASWRFEVVCCAAGAAFPALAGQTTATCADAEAAQLHRAHGQRSAGDQSASIGAKHAQEQTARREPERTQMSNMSAMTAQMPAQIHPARASCHLPCNRTASDLLGGGGNRKRRELGGVVANALRPSRTMAPLTL